MSPSTVYDHRDDKGGNDKSASGSSVKRTNGPLQPDEAQEDRQGNPQRQLSRHGRAVSRSGERDIALLA